MKKGMFSAILVLSLVLLLSNSGVLSAQTPTPAPTPAPTPRPTKIEGRVTALDLQAKKITITPAQGPAVTLTVAASTKVEVWGKEPATLADLKVGDRLEATYNPANLEAIQIETKGRGESARGERQGFFGTVRSLTTNSLTLDTKQGTVAFTVNADTEYWNPPNQEATLREVKTGDRVAVLAEKTATALVARRVLIIPAKPTHQHIKGVVTKIAGTEITITYDTDKTVTADAPLGIARKIELGDLVTATILRTPGVEKVLLKDVESSDKLLERLQRQAEKKTGKDKDDIDKLIERNQQKHQEVLQRVLDKAPEAARPGIQKALEKSKAKAKPAPTPERTPAPGKAPAAPGKSAEEAPGKGRP